MLLLTGASDLLRLITSAAASIDAHASYVDLASGTITPGRTNTATISTATTQTVVGSPGSGVYRTVKTLDVRNRHASQACDVTVVHTDGTNALELIKVTLNPGETLQYDEGMGFTYRDSLGRPVMNDLAAGIQIGTPGVVILGADVTNNNATANTIADITGLSFPVTAALGYRFKATIFYTAAATTTGARFSINGPATPTQLNYRSESALTTTSQSVNEGLSAYDNPAASSASSAATGANVAVVEGFIQPSAAGTVIARFASEVSSSAIVAKKGSMLEWWRVF